MEDIISPIVNNNGTSKDALMTELKAAMRAVSAASRAMGPCMPNGRDYQTYPDSWDKATQARQRHVEETRKLAEVFVYLEQMALAVYEQGPQR